MDGRLRQQNRFQVGLADIKISRHHLRKEVILILTETEYDQYQDSTNTEIARVKKWAIVEKNPDMNFVQELGDTLLEDTEQLPWLVTLTMTNMPRHLNHDDSIIIDGMKYTVSFVKPSNRFLQGVFYALVYPERNVVEDNLLIYSVQIRKGLQVFKTFQECFDTLGETTVTLDIVYGGYPKYLKIDSEYYNFTSFFQYNVKSGREVKLAILDSKKRIAEVLVK